MRRRDVYESRKHIPVARCVQLIELIRAIVIRVRSWRVFSGLSVDLLAEGVNLQVPLSLNFLKSEVLVIVHILDNIDWVDVTILNLLVNVNLLAFRKPVSRENSTLRSLIP